MNSLNRFIFRNLKCFSVFICLLLILAMILHRHGGQQNAARDSSTVHTVHIIGHTIVNKTLVKTQNFTTTRKVDSYIPPYLHYVFGNSEAPLQYKALIKRCLDINSELKVILWTTRNAREFIKKHYPEVYPIYNKYGDRLQRSDAIRYIVLYHFGGVYLDMDMSCERNLLEGFKRMNTTCVVDQERWEQTRIWWNMEFCAMNSAMACSARHPFFKYLIERLHFHKGGSLVGSTGPQYLTGRFMEFKRKNGDKHKVLVAHPEVFSPYIDDPGTKMRNRCSGEAWKKWNKNAWNYKGCKELSEANWGQSEKRFVNNRTLARHLFLHLGYDFAKHNIRGRFNLTVTFPKMLLYPNIT